MISLNCGKSVVGISRTMESNIMGELNQSLAESLVERRLASELSTGELIFRMAESGRFSARDLIRSGTKHYYSAALQNVPLVLRPIIKALPPDFLYAYTEGGTAVWSGEHQPVKWPLEAGGRWFFDAFYGVFKIEDGEFTITVYRIEAPDRHAIVRPVIHDLTDAAAWRVYQSYSRKNYEYDMVDYFESVARMALDPLNLFSGLPPEAMKQAAEAAKREHWDAYSNASSDDNMLLPR